MFSWLNTSKCHLKSWIAFIRWKTHAHFCSCEFMSHFPVSLVLRNVTENGLKLLTYWNCGHDKWRTVLIVFGQGSSFVVNVANQTQGELNFGINTELEIRTKIYILICAITNLKIQTSLQKERKKATVIQSQLTSPNSLKCSSTTI